MHQGFGISVLKDRQPGVKVVAHLDKRRLYLIGACFTELILVLLHVGVKSEASDDDLGIG